MLVLDILSSKRYTYLTKGIGLLGPVTFYFDQNRTTLMDIILLHKRNS